MSELDEVAVAVAVAGPNVVAVVPAPLEAAPAALGSVATEPAGVSAGLPAPVPNTFAAVVIGPSTEKDEVLPKVPSPIDEEDPIPKDADEFPTAKVEVEPPIPTPTVEVPFPKAEDDEGPFKKSSKDAP